MNLPPDTCVAPAPQCKARAFSPIQAKEFVMKTKFVTVVALGALALITATGASAQSRGPHECAAIRETEVSALFDRWNSSLATLDPDKVVANYAPDGVLLATLSNKPRTTPDEIRSYFVKFLAKHPQGKIDRHIIRIGCNVAQDIGIYTFTFKDGKSVQARYSYIYEWTNGKWLIAHHHSSAMPE